MRSFGIGQSDTGRKRKSNEDKFLGDNYLGLYIVCDGMGGHAAGEVASEIALQSVVSYVAHGDPRLKLIKQSGSDPSELVSIAQKAALKACEDVYRAATSKPDLAGMGCALTLLLVAGEKAAMAHVGDTRLYLCRENVVHLLSTDHTLAAELAKSGLLPLDQVRGHPYAHVLTRVIGTQESVEVDTLLLDLLPGDRFLLCSDGLSNCLREDDWLVRQMTNEVTECIPQNLINFANEEGGKDNITALLVHIEVDPEEEYVVPVLSGEIQAKLSTLGSVFLFEDLSLAQLSRVLDASKVREFRAGEVAISEGEPSCGFLLVLDGRFSLSRRNSGSVELGRGNHVGEAMLLCSRPCHATLRALEDSRLLILGQEPFLALLRSRPTFGILILERLGRRLSLELAKEAAEKDPRNQGLKTHGEET